MLGVSSFPFRLIIRIGIGEVLIVDRIISFGIELYGIIIFIQIFNYAFIAESILIEQFTGATPSGVHIHKYFFRIFLLGGKSLLHGHPIDLLRLGSANGKN